MLKRYHFEFNQEFFPSFSVRSDLSCSSTWSPALRASSSSRNSSSSIYKNQNIKQLLLFLCTYDIFNSCLNIEYIEYREYIKKSTILWYEMISYYYYETTPPCSLMLRMHDFPLIGHIHSLLSDWLVHLYHSFFFFLTGGLPS